MLLIVRLSLQLPNANKLVVYFPRIQLVAVPVQCQIKSFFFILRWHNFLIS
jgi:hypothetical protein